MSAGVRTRVATGAAFAVLLALGAAWLAGALFFLAGRVSPIGAVDLTTWWTYWQHYGDTAHRTRLLGSLGYAATAALVVFAFIATALVPRRSLHGNAHFGTQGDAKDAGLLDGVGVFLGRMGRQYVMVSALSVLVLARTGSGKGVSVVVPTLLSYRDSVVCLDVKLENYLLTSAYREAHGQDVFLFAPFAADSRTHGWNPLGRLPGELEARVAMVMSIARFWYPSSPSEVDIWQPSARNLFVALTLYVYETPHLPTTMGEVLRQGSGKGAALRDHVESIKFARNYRPVQTGIDKRGEPVIKQQPMAVWDGEGDPPLSDPCIHAIDTFLGATGNTATSIGTTFTAALSVFSHPLVDAATSRSDFDLSELRTRRMSVYVGVTPDKIPEAGTLLAAFFAEAFNVNMREEFGARDDIRYRCLFLLDEALSLGRVEQFEKGASYMRSYGLQLCTVAQNTAQVLAPPPRGYGEKSGEAFIDCHPVRTYYTPSRQSEARELSDILGDTTAKSHTRPRHGRHGGTISDQRRPLMMPQELRRLPRDEQIIITDDAPPIRCRKVAYFRDRGFVLRLKDTAPSLARIWWRRLRQKDIERAKYSGELASDVPVIDLLLHRARIEQRVRVMTTADLTPAAPLDLARLAADFGSLPVLDDDATATDVAALVDSVWSALEGSADDATTDTSDDGGSAVQRDTEAERA